MLLGDMDPTNMFTFMMGDDGTDVFPFIMSQMTVKQGLQHFRSAGSEAIMKELEQLMYRKVMEGCNSRQLSPTEKKVALQYLMFIKQNHCGRIKGQGCTRPKKKPNPLPSVLSLSFSHVSSMPWRDAKQ